MSPYPFQPYRPDEDLKERARKAVEKLAAEWRKKTDIKFNYELRRNVGFEGRDKR